MKDVEKVSRPSLDPERVGGSVVGGLVIVVVVIIGKIVELLSVQAHKTWL